MFNFPSEILDLQDAENINVIASEVYAPLLSYLQENLDRLRWNSFSCRARPGSQSAPLFAENKFDSAEKTRQMLLSSTRKLHTYVLPTPVDTKSSISTGSCNPIPHKTQTTLNEHTQNLWHSSPLEQKKLERVLVDEKFSGPTVISAQSVLKESNNNASTWLPPPSADRVLLSQHYRLAASDPKKLKRHAFSGPLTSQPWSTKSVSVESPHLYSGPLLRNPMSQVPSTSPTGSPTYMSSPKISELHELPRPPASSTSKSSKPMDFTGHSAPLGSRDQELSAKRKSIVSNAASPLPTPPQTIARSFSIPSSSPSVMTSHASKPLEALRGTEKVEDVASPPLTPITLSSNQQLSPGSETVTQAIHIGGNVETDASFFH